MKTTSSVSVCETYTVHLVLIMSHQLELTLKEKFWSSPKCLVVFGVVYRNFTRPKT